MSENVDDLPLDALRTGRHVLRMRRRTRASSILASVIFIAACSGAKTPQTVDRAAQTMADRSPANEAPRSRHDHTIVLDDDAARALAEAVRAQLSPQPGDPVSGHIRASARPGIVEVVLPPDRRNVMVAGPTANGGIGAACVSSPEAIRRLASRRIEETYR